MTAEQQAASPRLMEATAQAFIEVQFPVSKLSKESYKERMSNMGQTLPSLGKWWGRKPLVLVRAIILGLLLPATDNPTKDREVFLKLLTMDDGGLWRRVVSVPAAAVYDQLSPREREGWFDLSKGKPRWARGSGRKERLAERERLKRRAFFRMGYDKKLEYCLRPEEIDGPSPEAWVEINAHLGTQASDLPELVRELSARRFGRVVRVGDAFSGGGSIPFEAARVGCDALGSDLNPVATLLTWGALNIVGGGPETVAKVQAAQQRVYEAVKQQVAEWGIERNEDGQVADAYLYCNEVMDPATGWRVPLAPSWVVGEGTRTIARLVPDRENHRFDIEIHQGVTPEELAEARREGTWRNGVCCPVDREGNWLPPSRRQVTGLEQLKGREGLRLWEAWDILPRPDDLFQERIYCIRWARPGTGDREYRAPTEEDQEHERRVLQLLLERFHDWQSKGYIPSRPIEPGDDNMRPTNARGWTHWHHFFNPRQLLLGGLIAECSDRLGLATTVAEKVGLLMTTARFADLNSRLCRWHGVGDNENSEQTFYTPALNTPMVSYGVRPVAALKTTLCMDLSSAPVSGAFTVKPSDCREVDWEADFWITDPGYADAINYAENSELFLAWYDKRLPALFPDWYADSKRALKVEGRGDDFRVAMVGCYRQLARRMPDSGFQVVMFTHQRAEVWADLALVLWAAGLQVTAAWTIATETEAAGLKQGNYVQGTVVMVLRKRRGDRRGDLSDIFPDIQPEVQRQLESMMALDDKDDPNFGDADYQLAAYAAALRVLTSYSSIGDINVERELRRTRGPGERSPLTPLIERAVKIASDFLVPDGLDRAVWKKLSPEERFYLKGVEVESHGEYREGVYQEFARGFGVKEYRSLLGSDTANQVRLRTPREFASRNLGGEGFAGSLLRRVLFGVYTTAAQPEMDPRPGRQYLRHEDPDYWGNRQTIIALLRFLANKPKPAGGMPQWEQDVKAAALLLGSVESDSI